MMVIPKLINQLILTVAGRALSHPVPDRRDTDHPAISRSSVMTFFRRIGISSGSSKRGDDTEQLRLLVKKLDESGDSKLDDLETMKGRALSGDIGALKWLIERIEQDGNADAVDAVHKVIVSGNDCIKEDARTELELASADKLTERAFAGDRPAVKALRRMVEVAENDQAYKGLSFFYAELAKRVINDGDREAWVSLERAALEDPLAIPPIGMIAAEGGLEAWEALCNAVESGNPLLVNRAIETMRTIPVEKLVDKVRDETETDEKTLVGQIVDRTVNVLKMVAVKVVRPAGISELETMANERAGVALRNLADRRHPGAQEAYGQWRQNQGEQTPPAGTPFTMESTSKTKKPRRDSTELGIPTPPRTPSPSRTKK